MPGCLGARTLGYYHCNKESGQPVGRHALRGACLGPPAEGTSVLPGPGRRRFAPTAGPRAFPRTAPRPQKPADAPLIREKMNFELRADGRHTLRGDCLGSPAKGTFPLPGPGTASLRSDAPGLGLYKRMLAALQSPGSRRSVAPHRLCAPQPPLYSPALPCGCNRPRCRALRHPVGRFTPAPVRPEGAPSTPPGRA